MINKILIFVFVFIFSACTTPKINTFIHTNNEGIFIKNFYNKSVSLHFQNPSNIQTKLEQKLSQALEQKGLRVVKENADMQILLNIVDFRKLMYAQRMSNYTYTFFYGPFMRVDADVEFENYFLMQVNLQVIQGVNSQSTSLVARTSYLAGVSESKEALEDKIVTQIISFFY